MGVIVETGDTAWNAHAEPCEAEEDADTKQNANPVPNSLSHVPCDLSVALVVTKLACCLERIRCFGLVSAWKLLVLDLYNLRRLLNVDDLCWLAHHDWLASNWSAHRRIVLLLLHLFNYSNL